MGWKYRAKSALITVLSVTILLIVINVDLDLSTKTGSAYLVHLDVLSVMGRPMLYNVLNV